MMDDSPYLSNLEDSSVSDDTAGGDTEYTTDDECSPTSNNGCARENPLLNPVILQHLFQLCPVSIVASCRPVCKMWYDESLTTWRTTFPLPITTTSSGYIFVGGSFLSEGFSINSNPTFRTRTPLEEFQEFINKPEYQCSMRPFRNILVLGGPSLRGYEEYWEAIGSNITILSLSGCTFNDIEGFRQVIYNCCPILQRLNIVDCDFKFRAEKAEEEDALEYKDPLYGEHNHLMLLHMRAKKGKHFPLSWIELFSHFPLMTSFRVTYSQVPEDEFENLARAIRIVRKHNPRKLPFKRFQIHSYLETRGPASHNMFAVVKELRLPLKHCSISVIPEMDIGTLTRALTYLAPSLNTILLNRKANQNRILPYSASFKNFIRYEFQDFPFGVNLDNLTRLESRGDLIGSFAFLKYTPNLSRLDVGVRTLIGIATTAVSNTCKEELANLQMLRLTTFKLALRVSDDDIQHLFKWMPNITDLTMSLNDKQFGMVCQNWKNLRKLTVLLTWRQMTLTEKGITGIKAGRTPEKLARRPNIANLESLEFIDLGIVKLTPESVYHLFHHLPNLQILHHEGWDRLSAKIHRGDLFISSYQRAIQDLEPLTSDIEITPELFPSFALLPSLPQLFQLDIQETTFPFSVFPDLPSPPRLFHFGCPQPVKREDTSQGVVEDNIIVVEPRIALEGFTFVKRFS